MQTTHETKIQSRCKLLLEAKWEKCCGEVAKALAPRKSMQGPYSRALAFLSLTLPASKRCVSNTLLSPILSCLCKNSISNSLETEDEEALAETETISVED